MNGYSFAYKTLRDMNISRMPKRIFGKLSKRIIANGKMTIISGASDYYYDCLRRNLDSIVRYEKHAHIIIWNLGLNDSQVAELKKFASSREGVIFLDYPEDELSAHYAMKQHNYSFKSYCISHSLPMIETKYAMWLDACCRLTGPLDAERNILHLYGYYSPYSSTSIGKLTHPAVMDKFFNGKDSYAQKQMLSGGIQGWRMNDYKALSLLSEWANLTRLEDNISPQGASSLNHRYDQSLISILYYTHYDKVPYLAGFRYNVRVHS